MNFVDVVGYQFERVHTGVISRLLDTRYSDIHMDVRYQILQKLFVVINEIIPFKQEEIESINCIKEYSFGRRIKVDLVVEIKTRRETIYLVVEMKVDSVPTSEQLKITERAFQALKSEDTAYFILTMMGTSQVCVPKELFRFRLLKLEDIINIFSGFSLTLNLYTDWLEALKEEFVRKNKVIDMIRESPGKHPISLDRQYFEPLGYRIPFPLYYYIYSHFIREFSDTNYRDWRIYSGSNNPVCYCYNAGLPNNVEFDQKIYYWEFNYDDFCLKLHNRNGISDSKISQIRDGVEKVCKQTRYAGKRTKNTSGTYLTLYKWGFDFRKQDLNYIANNVVDILNVVDPILVII